MIPRTRIENRSSALAAALIARREATDRLRHALGVRYDRDPPLLFSCASAALYFLLRVHNAGRIYLPAYGCRALVEACYFAGRLKDLVLIDIDPETFAMDMAELERVLVPGSTIVAVHPYGIPLDMGHVTRLARARDSLLVEDAAAAFGARFCGRPVGTFGDVALFSFEYSKTVSGCGGGAAFFADRRLEGEVAALRDSEIATAGNKKGFPAPFKGLGFQAACWGAIYGGVFFPLLNRGGVAFRDDGRIRPERLSVYHRGIQAGQAEAACHALSMIECVLDRRKRLEERYLGLLNGHPVLASYRVPPGAESAMTLFPIRVTQGSKFAFHACCVRHGIDLGFSYSYINRTGSDEKPFATAETAAKQVLNLPFYSSLTEREFSRIAAAIAS